jgi:hypothetical protein
MAHWWSMPELVRLSQAAHWTPERPRFSLFVLKACTQSFWIIPKLSSMVIMNLIANLPFLYHKAQEHAVIRID